MQIKLPALVMSRGSRGSGVVRRPNARTRSDTDRGSETVWDSASNRGPRCVFLLNLEEGETRANPEALKGFCGSSELRSHKESSDD